MTNQTFFHLQYSCNDNRVNAEDGEYILKHRCSDYNTGWEDNLYNLYREKDYFSKSKVIVRGGLVDIKTLTNAYREIQSQHNYYGKFIERQGFDGTYITIGIGS